MTLITLALLIFFSPWLVKHTVEAYNEVRSFWIFRITTTFPFISLRNSYNEFYIFRQIFFHISHIISLVEATLTKGAHRGSISLDDNEKTLRELNVFCSAVQINRLCHLKRQNSKINWTIFMTIKNKLIFQNLIKTFLLLKTEKNKQKITRIFGSTLAGAIIELHIQSRCKDKLRRTMVKWSKVKLERQWGS